MLIIHIYNNSCSSLRLTDAERSYSIVPCTNTNAWFTMLTVQCTRVSQCGVHSSYFQLSSNVHSAVCTARIALRIVYFTYSYIAT